MDSAEEEDKTGLLKMREILNLQEALMGPGGDAPVPRVALIPPLQIQSTQVGRLTSVISWLGWKKGLMVLTSQRNH